MSKDRKYPSRGFWLDKRDAEWEIYIAGAQIKEDFAIGKMFDNPSGLLWSSFLRGYYAAEYRMRLTAFGAGILAFLVGFGICWLILVL